MAVQTVVPLGLVKFQPKMMILPLMPHPKPVDTTMLSDGFVLMVNQAVTNRSSVW